MIKKILVPILAGVGAISLIGLLLYFVVPDGFPFAWEYSEHGRRTSPDGRFDAVVLRGNAGAMSGYQFEIYVVGRDTIVERERDCRHCVYKSYENSGSFTYLWKDADLYVTVEETPIQHFWPYYFVKEPNERMGYVFLEFKRTPIEKREANHRLEPTPTAVTSAAGAAAAPAVGAAHH